jgi:hypothetical protein
MWFAWAFVTFGTEGALLENTSISAADTRIGGQLRRIALNVRDTIVPYFLRPLDTSLIAQASPWGLWRDRIFQLYQTNLLFAFGSVGWIALVRLLWQTHRAAPPASRLAAAGLIGGMILLGIGVHGARDTWGLVHICLQPLVIAGLAFIAANAVKLGRGWRNILMVGAAVDLLLGIVLHFAVQNLAFERWAGAEAFARWQEDNSLGAVMNLAAKLKHELVFLNDVWPLPWWVTLLLLGMLLTSAIRNSRARPASVKEV